MGPADRAETIDDRIVYTRVLGHAEILDSQRRFSAQYAHWKRLAYLPRDF